MIKKKLLILCLCCLFPLLCAACENEEKLPLNPAQQGNSDYNLHNLGLSAETADAVFTVGTKNGYDLIFEAAPDGTLKKAVSGLVGYIQYLNIIGDTIYFVGITYDEYGQRTESVFSVNRNGENQNCVCSAEAGETITYFTAADQLLIFAAEDETGKTILHAVNPEDQTEAVLFKENSPIRSLQIHNDRFYYICENKIFAVDPDGSNKTKICKSENQIENPVFIDDEMYFIEIGENDRIMKITEEDTEPKAVFQNGKYIAHMNVYQNNIIFSDHSRDAEGNLKKAEIYKLNTETGEITKIFELENEYTGVEVCGDHLFIHLNDEHLTLKTIPLN